MKRARFSPTRLLETLYRSWRHEITPAGKWVVAGVMLSALGSVSVQIPIYQVFCALVALLFIALLTGLILWPNVSLEVRLPERSTAGQPVTGEVHVSNRSRRPIYDLVLGLYGLPDPIRQQRRDDIIPYLGRGDSLTLPVSIEASRRGLYELPDLRAYTSFPFGLFLIGKCREQTGSLLVLPSFHPLVTVDVPLGTRYQPGGIALTSHVGESPEYIGNREYVPGEPARRLDFRSWARLAKPVVREYQEEYYCRIALIVDTYVFHGKVWGPMRRGPGGVLYFGQWPGEHPSLEAGISLAAAVADALSRGEYLIDLFAAGPELYVFRAGRHTAHFENVLEILACVDVCRDDPFETVTPAISDELGNISTAVCIFLDWDDSRRRMAHAILEAGCSLKAVIIREGPTTMPLDADEFTDIQQFHPAQVLSGGIDVL